jgi:hypothetical protein
MAISGTVQQYQRMHLVSDGITTCGNMTDVVVTLRR